MEKHLQVLMNNFHNVENTFIYKLNEEALFDYPSFWEYYNSIRGIIKETLDNPLNREIARAISNTYSKVLEFFIHEYSDNDMYQMKDFPFDKLNLLLLRYPL